MPRFVVSKLNCVVGPNQTLESASSMDRRSQTVQVNMNADITSKLSSTRLVAYICTLSPRTEPLQSEVSASTILHLFRILHAPRAISESSYNGVSNRVSTDVRSSRERTDAQCELKGVEKEAWYRSTTRHWEEFENSL